LEEAFGKPLPTCFRREDTKRSKKPMTGALVVQDMKDDQETMIVEGEMKIADDSSCKVMDLSPE